MRSPAGRWTARTRGTNLWRDNTYVEPWTFLSHATSRTLDVACWPAALDQHDEFGAFTPLTT